MQAQIDLGVTRDGLTQLRRYWPAPDPWMVSVIVHGIGEHSARYHHVAKHLNAHGISAVGYDHRGFGQSGGRRGFVHEFDRFLDDLEDHHEQAKKLGLPTAIIGHSMGGLITTAYAVSGRPQPKAYVVSGPALDADVPGPLRAIAPLMSKALPAFHIAPQFDSDVLSRDRSVVEDYDTDPLIVKGSTARLGAEMFATMEATIERLGNIDVPMLVQHGGADALVPPHASAHLEGRPGIERKVYEGLRHEIYNETEPDRSMVLNDLTDFLRSFR